MKEYKDLSIDEIMSYIEANPRIYVSNNTNQIQGMNVEDAFGCGALIHYDLLFDDTKEG
ncbi:MAG: hypothetical protein HFE68_07755 [Erysipelotrichaceae bacterium]|nr:hypothetical protein [Erysipelotrichaceae bacterium]